MVPTKAGVAFSASISVGFTKNSDGYVTNNGYLEKRTHSR